VGRPVRAAPAPSAFQNNMVQTGGRIALTIRNEAE